MGLAHNFSIFKNKKIHCDYCNALTSVSKIWQESENCEKIPKI